MTLAIRGTEFVIRAEPGAEPAHRVRGRGAGQQRRRASCRCPAGQSAVARAGQAPQRLSGRAPARRRAVVALLPADLLRPAGRRAGAGRGAAAGRRRRHRRRARGARPAAGRAATPPRRPTARRCCCRSAGPTRPEPRSTRRWRPIPRSGDALALRAVIGVVQNERDAALADARKAVELGPDLGRRQDRAVLRAAGQLRPRGRARDDAAGGGGAARGRAGLGAAVRALADGRLSRPVARGRRAGGRRWRPISTGSQTVRGFADLVEFRTAHRRRPRSSARSRSTRPTRCRASASASPRSATAASSRAAPTSSSRSASIPATRCCAPISARPISRSGARSCRPSSTQLAKELDPLDPTAYLYDAIRLQTINRPVEALRQLDKSIELNDNRAVYRCRLLLDSDRAARGASLAAHLPRPRLPRHRRARGHQLADARPDQPERPPLPVRHLCRRAAPRDRAGQRAAAVADAAGRSTSTRSQPRLSETNLNIVTQGGPATPGFNEFTPLFERNGLQVNGHRPARQRRHRRAARSRPRRSTTATRSAPARSATTPTAGATTTTSSHKIYNVFFQAAITPELNAQLEFRSRRTTRMAIIEQVWDPDDFSTSTRSRHRPGQLPRRPALVADAELGRAAVVDLQRHRRQGGAGQDTFVRCARSRRPISRTKAISRRSSISFVASDSM